MYRIENQGETYFIEDQKELITTLETLGGYSLVNAIKAYWVDQKTLKELEEVKRTGSRELELAEEREYFLGQEMINGLSKIAEILFQDETAIKKLGQKRSQAISEIMRELQNSEYNSYPEQVENI